MPWASQRGIQHTRAPRLIGDEAVHSKPCGLRLLGCRSISVRLHVCLAPPVWHWKPLPLPGLLLLSETPAPLWVTCRVPIASAMDRPGRLGSPSHSSQPRRPSPSFFFFLTLMLLKPSPFCPATEACIFPLDFSEKRRGVRQRRWGAAGGGGGGS